MTKNREDDDEVEEKVVDNPFTTARIERKYLDFLKSKGYSTNDVLRMFYEGKLKEVDIKNEEEKHEAKKDSNEGGSVSGSKINRTIEDVVSKQIETYMTTVMDGYTKSMQELQEKAKKADELERKNLEKEIEALKEKMEYLERHRDEIKRELMQEELKKRGMSETERRVMELEQKLDMLIKKMESNPIDQYKEGLQRMTELKKTLDEAFRAIFPDYVPRSEAKTDWNSIIQLLSITMPTIQNIFTSGIRAWVTMNQIQTLLMRADRAKNDKIADKYLDLADLLTKSLQARVETPMIPVQANVGQANPNVSNVGNNIPVARYEDIFISTLGSVTPAEIERFKKGEISLIPLIESQLQNIVAFLKNNPALIDQIRSLEPEVVIDKIKEVRKDIVVDELFTERIKNEVVAIKEMILDALGEQTGSAEVGTYGF